ncbi:MAG TPA: hypothetical protein PLB10_12105, partial [Thiolinea sp.]|nr:hypothetical protein [Thiolinea sp.]
MHTLSWCLTNNQDAGSRTGNQYGLGPQRQERLTQSTAVNCSQQIIKVFGFFGRHQGHGDLHQLFRISAEYNFFSPENKKPLLHCMQQELNIKLGI